eukprot:TRINITY_DN34047_c0_g1_i1.p1 TRINITY_DN34047_c0_g1~~TRINITY_DN34047_c0_g1_i1.p1  ORF type:complete len:261 (+),score=30.29 TRINITY_DN34047_c0_g1_i1:100-882(+)
MFAFFVACATAATASATCAPPVADCNALTYGVTDDPTCRREAVSIAPKSASDSEKQSSTPAPSGPPSMEDLTRTMPEHLRELLNESLELQDSNCEVNFRDGCYKSAERGRRGERYLYLKRLRKTAFDEVPPSGGFPSQRCQLLWVVAPWNVSYLHNASDIRKEPARKGRGVVFEFRVEGGTPLRHMGLALDNEGGEILYQDFCHDTRFFDVEVTSIKTCDSRYEEPGCVTEFEWSHAGHWTCCGFKKELCKRFGGIPLRF